MASVIAPVLRHAGVDPDHTAFRSEYAQERTVTALATATPIVEPEAVARGLL